jgi:hypothetical protein
VVVTTQNARAHFWQIWLQDLAFVKIE